MRHIVQYANNKCVLKENVKCHHRSICSNKCSLERERKDLCKYGQHISHFTDNQSCACSDFFCSNRNRSGKMAWTRSYWNWIDRNFILKLINHFQFEQKKLRERNSERDGFSSLQIHHRLTSNFIKCTYIPIKCNRI